MEENQKTKLFPVGFNEFPEAVKNRITSLCGLFIGGGIVMFLLFITAGLSEFWYMPLLLLIYGIYVTGQLCYLASNGKLREKEGVLIDKETGGYRKQNHYLIIQTPDGNVYRVIATEKHRHYRTGDIVRFYSVPEALTHLKDGVFEVRVVYAIERISAKVTTEEEDEKIRLQEEREKELQQNA